MRLWSVLAVAVFSTFSVACASGQGGGLGSPDGGSEEADADGQWDAADLADAAPLDGAPEPDAPSLTPSELIAAARSTADGNGLTLAIQDATVTYLKPVGGTPASDPAGFTIQAEQNGPALFIAVDPATLNPPAARGDVVDFTITTKATVSAQPRATAITGYTRTSTGANVGALAQDVSSKTDLVSALPSYDSELVDFTAVVAADFGAAGNGFESATVNTTGLTGNANLLLRVPTTVRDGVDLVNGCRVTVNDTPVGRFTAQTQLAAFSAADITSMTDCPAPTVVSAVALSATSVRVTFSRRILASSVTANGSQFTFDNGLTASAATVSGRTVTVTTTTQVGGTTYTVTVAPTVTDLQAATLAMPYTATFSGFVTPAVVKINELNANIGTSPATCDLIELRVLVGGSMSNYKLTERLGTSDSMSLTFTGLNVQKNDIIVVHTASGNATCNPGTATQETTAPNQQPTATYAGNYDTAYDWWSTDNGLFNTDNVITLHDAGGNIIDAVFVTDDDPVTAGNTETQAAKVGAADQWMPKLATYLDAVFAMYAVANLNATGTTAAGDSIQRLDDTDDNDKADWTAAPAASTFGLLNANQLAQ